MPTKEALHFAPGQTEENKKRVIRFLENIEGICEKHHLSIDATEHDGMLIYNSDVEANIWSIGPPEKRK